MAEFSARDLELITEMVRAALERIAAERAADVDPK